MGGGRGEREWREGRKGEGEEGGRGRRRDATLPEALPTASRVQPPAAGREGGGGGERGEGMEGRVGREKRGGRGRREREEGEGGGTTQLFLKLFRLHRVFSLLQQEGKEVGRMEGRRGEGREGGRGRRRDATLPEALPTASRVQPPAARGTG